MSAIAAIPKLLGIHPTFVDIDEHYCIDIAKLQIDEGDLVIAVNMFGHPAALHNLREKCDNCNSLLIEDNAQAPWATENDTYTGTIGHLGCWSFNVHKFVQAGEGGMVTTNDQTLADTMRGFINHGEVAGGLCGLNLRMPELTAVIILAQMQQAREVVRRRREIWSALSEAGTDSLVMPEERPHCISSWYCHPILAPNEKARDRAVKMLQAEGLPCRAGYTLIHKLPAFSVAVDDQTFPVAEALNSRMVLLELASIDPSDDQLEQMVEAIDAVGRHL